MTTQKRIGFLSFGHWQPIPGSQVRTDAGLVPMALVAVSEKVWPMPAVRPEIVVSSVLPPTVTVATSAEPL